MLLCLLSSSSLVHLAKFIICTAQEDHSELGAVLFMLYIKEINSCSPIKRKVYYPQACQCLHLLRQRCQKIISAYQRETNHHQ